MKKYIVLAIMAWGIAYTPVFAQDQAITKKRRESPKEG